MIITDLSIASCTHGFTTSANIEWEASEFPKQRLFFEVRNSAIPIIAPSADAFLLACYPLAALHGEPRVQIHGNPCPMLVEGLLTAHAWWAAWGGIGSEAPVIETAPAGPRPVPWLCSAAVFVSGGVDGFHTVMGNRSLFSREDPASIRQALFIEGYDISTRSWRPEPERYRQALALLEPVMAEADVRVLPCRTNLRDLPSRRGFWTYRHNGAALVAAGHVAVPSRGFLFIGSGYHLKHRVAMGSCPELDPLYSSQRLSVQHFGARLTRVQKLRELASWPRAIAALRVCPGGAADGPNCGVCEKCLRTRLELLVAGIEETPTLGPSLTPVEQWEALPPTVGHRTFMYDELISELQSLGHDALCRVLLHRTATYDAWTRAEEPWPAL